MILLDTSGFLAAHAPDQRRHAECAEILRRSPGPFVLSPYVLAEIDYLIAKLVGVEAELRLLAEVERKAYIHPSFDEHDLGEARGVIDRYRDLRVGLADASLVVLSRRYSTVDILTLDERHFRAMRGAKRASFRLLPADA